jgi:hypothetical protein
MFTPDVKSRLDWTVLVGKAAFKLGFGLICETRFRRERFGKFGASATMNSNKKAAIRRTADARDSKTQSVVYAQNRSHFCA